MLRRSYSFFGELRNHRLWYHSEHIPQLEYDVQIKKADGYRILQLFWWACVPSKILTLNTMTAIFPESTISVFQSQLTSLKEKGNVRKSESRR